MLFLFFSGVSTIRAFGAESRFVAENMQRLDANHRAFYFLWASNRWLHIRSTAISSIIIIVSACATVSSSDWIGPGLAGLSLTWALTFSDTLIWLVRAHANLEMVRSFNRSLAKLP
jgi:ABC-type multidrug transport system fused ATPase/permease subunit